ncbi:MAG TPA: VanZ family protein [Urbifossiella sp.]|nr:VanZ family protein [Urbifossiella sp.]
MTPTPRFARWLLGGLALAAAAFILGGSLVPFDFRSRGLSEAVDSFLWAMQRRWWPESRSDGIANVLLGIPLGFALLGLLRTGRTGVRGDIVWGLLLVPACMAFAAAVEFAQLFVPERTCAGSDVLCQGFGAAIGAVGWMAAGRWLVRQAEAMWWGADAAGQILMAYLVLLAFIQLLPLDLSASPRDLYHKLRDDVVYVPFFEFHGAGETKLLARTARLVQVFGLYVPTGLLLRRTRSDLPLQTFLLVLGITCGMEGLQLIVHSRQPSATDVVVGMAGFLMGWWCSYRRGIPLLSLGIAWLLGLAFVSWEPFESAGPVLRSFDWIPGMPLESANPLSALEQMLTKLVLFGLGGSLVTSPYRAAALGLVVSSILEAGQMALAAHTPCITDVLLGGLGTFLGRQLSRDRQGAVRR